jgi:hypothetical protein
MVPRAGPLTRARASRRAPRAPARPTAHDADLKRDPGRRDASVGREHAITPRQRDAHARLRDGLRSMQRSGKLDPTADPDGLATATLASIQGGLLLTQARRDHAPLATALDAAYANLRAHAASTRGRVA